MDYPKNCLRGISNHDFIDAEGIVKSDLFQFQDKNRREDGWIEESINWEDDEKAINFTLKQTKEGTLQFKGGVALIPTEDLNRLKRKPAYSGKVDFERRELDDNQYHGNLLLSGDVSKHVKRMIASYLAIVVSEIVSQDSKGLLSPPSTK